MSKSDNEAKPVVRSHSATLSWQLGGVINAVRLAVSRGIAPGKLTIELLTNLRKQIETNGEKGLGLKGVAIDNVPHIDAQSNLIDILAVAEALNGLVQCYLSPDERKEQRKSMGFPVPNNA